MNVPKSSLEYSHFPVMLNEVLKVCAPKIGGSYVDCTFGGGGYSIELLKFSKTKVIALDRDILTKKKADEIKNKYSDRFSFHNEKFSNLNKILSEKNKVDAIIFDLGISSNQLFDLKRGFSFKSKGKIDMNMGLASTSAEEILNTFDEYNLNLIIGVLGEEKESSRIAKNIIKARDIQKISTVSDLVRIIESSKKFDYKKKINICTKTFQALRIFVNKETTELIEGIVNATKFVKEGGKIIIISFHSIEDKIVKFFFKNYSPKKSNPSRYSPLNERKNIFFKNFKKNLLVPTVKEVKKNPPSRSAKLRYVVRNSKEFNEPKDFKIKFDKYLQLESTNA